MMRISPISVVKKCFNTVEPKEPVPPVITKVLFLNSCVILLELFILDSPPSASMPYQTDEALIELVYCYAFYTFSALLKSTKARLVGDLLQFAS